ncbi:autotransporter-associated beta strand repeat-containing protein, partial [Sphingomonas sp.]|uniref:beta strand repeat-containing protein n=1 Tax=Sphingomonas sp. TaxID=28214 RepID=UPI0031CDDA16
MKASSGSKSGISRSSGGKRRLLAGTGGAALALASVLPSAASAADYVVNSEAELRQALLDAVANNDPNPRIVLGSSFSVSNTVFTLPDLPVAIDTQGFVLTGPAGNAVNIINSSATLNLTGTINGASGGGHGSGLILNAGSGTINSTATITGGAAQSAGQSPSFGVTLNGTGTFVNGGSIRGGDVVSAALSPTGTSAGSGVAIINGATLVNNGLIQGSNSQADGSGVGVYARTLTSNLSIVNTGTIRGGSDVNGVVAGNFAIGGFGSNIATITNSGLIEGGNGAAAISDYSQRWTVTIINSGTIRAGAGQSDAIRLDRNVNSLLLLELRAGSNIQGNVIAPAAATFAQTLALGGAADAGFDMSLVGPTAQYRNFTRFVKSGASTWTLTGSAAGMPSSVWELQQGTLLFDRNTAAGQLFVNIISSGTLNFQQDSDVSVGSINGGAVIQSGTGTTTLTAGAGYTYSGLTITGGKLSVDTAAKLGTGAVAINGGALRWTGSTGNITKTIDWGASGGGFEVAAGSLILSQPLLDGGAMTKSGSGVLTLVGDNTYTGGTTIAAGTLIIGNGGTTGSIVGDVLNNGRLTFNRSNAYTYAGSVTGTGELIIAGAGVTTLTGSSSYGGATGITGLNGELRIVGGAAVISGGATNINRAKLSIDGASSVFSTASLTGVGSLGGSAIVNVTDGGTLRTTAGDLAMRSLPILSAQLNIAGTGSLVDVAGGIQGAAVGNNVFTATVTAGGTLRTAGASQIGTATSTNPLAVAITGPGSNWTGASSLLMTAGTFTVDQGGGASFTNATFGSSSGATGAARLIVSGTDSRFATTVGDLVLGSGLGTGELVLSDRGAVNLAGSLVLANAGTATGILSIGGSEGQAATAVGTFTAPALTLGSATSRLNFNHTNTDYRFGAAISGAGAINQMAGDTNLTGDSVGFTGTTTVSGGTLRVNGTLGGAASIVNVLNGGRLGGAGTIGGSVNVADGVLAAGNSPGTLTIAGDLTLTAASLLDFEFGQSDVVGGPLNDLIDVGGNLTLDGTLDVTVTPGGSFDVGVYRVISYAGSLNDQGLVLGSVPGGLVTVQTSVANQVNLVNFAGGDVNFWDGNGARGDGILAGGDGVWQGGSGNDNWTVADGSINSVYPDGAFAIFMAAPGTVTVETSQGAVNASGMQFASSGYTITGGAIGLTAADSIIRVGDGTAAGAGFTATIASDLTGAGNLEKADLGTLVLTGTSTIAGDLAVRTGTLRLADGGTLANAYTVVGREAGEQAILVVTGSDGGGNASTWTTGDLAVGDNGTGTLDITAGGRVVSAMGNIGLNTAGVGQVVVSGAGSAWENSGRINVGLFGTGTMRIENGGQVSSNDGVVGSAAHGEVLVTGAGSIWSNVGQLTVGLGSTGSLRIENGASVTSNQGYVGANPGGDGSVTVTGAGSNWLAGPFSITIGHMANGSLAIENGGRVRAEGGVLLGTTAGMGGTLTLTGTAANRAVLETSGLTAGAGTASVSIDGGLLRATDDNDNFFNGFGTRDVTLGASGVLIDTGGHDIGISPRFVGAGGLIKDGAGTLRLTGVNTYGGATLINAGTLLVDGDQSAATGLTTVGAAGTLGGAGTIGGSVDMSAGGTLAPGSNGVGTLAINGNLVLGGGSRLAFEFGQANTAGGLLNDLVNVGGNLTLDGTIDVAVAPGGS